MNDTSHIVGRRLLDEIFRGEFCLVDRNAPAVKSVFCRTFPDNSLCL